MRASVTLERDTTPDVRRLLVMVALVAWTGFSTWRLWAAPPTAHTWWRIVTAGVPFLMLAATAFGTLYSLRSLTLDGQGLTLTSDGPFGSRTVFHAWADTSRFVADAWVPQGNGQVRAPVAAKVRVRTWWGRPCISLRLPDGFDLDREALAGTLNDHRASALPAGFLATGEEIPAPSNESRPGQSMVWGMALCVLVALVLCSSSGQPVRVWVEGVLHF